MHKRFRVMLAAPLGRFASGEYSGETEHQAGPHHPACSFHDGLVPGLQLVQHHHRPDVEAGRAGLQWATFAPATQFLGLDVTNVGRDGLSLHLFGWGRADLADQSLPESKTSGELTYGYVRYRFQQANAELKAGRFTVNQGVAIEQVDGVSAQADLRGGFTISPPWASSVYSSTRPGTPSPRRTTTSSGISSSAPVWG